MSDPAARLSRLHVSEVFRSLQGEGPTAGLPATFLRLAACNLRCSYCDTPYTWDFERFDKSKEVATYGIEQLLGRLLEQAPDRLVVTGGEPLLQQQTLAPLLLQLPVGMAVEVETNGTILPTAALWERVTQWNVSPKLALAGLPREERIIHSVLRQFADCSHAYLKLVVAEPSDMKEGDQLILETGWPAQRVIWMPEGTSAQRLSLRSRWLAEEALARNQRFSTRLHVLLWGDKRGC